MRTEILADPDAVAIRAARWLAEAARDAVAARGRFSLAVSGGHTPWKMLAALARERVPWEAVHLYQVDERVAPAGDPDRNWAHVRESMLEEVAIPAANLHPMPVGAPDLRAGAARYARELQAGAGAPAVLDVVHLGLGPDGHTASLVPGDPVLEITASDVGVTEAYAGRRRMTLTYPALDRARAVLFVVTGASKAPMLRRLEAGDRTIPAGRVRSDRATLLADRAAASGRDAP